jgi:hypothetical protein
MAPTSTNTLWVLQRAGYKCQAALPRATSATPLSAALTLAPGWLCVMPAPPSGPNTRTCYSPRCLPLSPPPTPRRGPTEGTRTFKPRNG